MPKNSRRGRSSGAGRWSRMKVSTCAVGSAIARLPAEGAASLPRRGEGVYGWVLRRAAHAPEADAAEPVGAGLVPALHMPRPMHRKNGKGRHKACPYRLYSVLDLVHVRAGGALLEVGGGDRAQAAGVVVADRLGDLVSRVHDEWAVEDHRLVDRPSAEQQHLA